MLTNISNISQTEFGKMPDGQIISLFNLTNSQGISIQLMNYGATIVSAKVPDKNGKIDEIVLGFDNLDAYLAHPFYFGCIIGRVANRISQARFQINNKFYQLPINFIQQHHIHGGLHGFDKAIWNVEIINNAEPSLLFSYTSKDGEEGYPGNLIVRVIYTLTSDNQLKLRYEATTDQPTPIDLTNHTYWNLAGAGSGDVLQHIFQTPAEKYIVTHPNQMPSGEIRSVANSPLDFRQPTPLNTHLSQLPNGYDVCYVLPSHQGLRHAATIADPTTGRTMQVHTNQNGLQFFTGCNLFEYAIANNKNIHKFGGFCMETQNFPDAINHTNFPSPILFPGQTYCHETIFKFI